MNDEVRAPIVTVKDIEWEFDGATGELSKILRLALSDGRVITDERFFDNVLRFRIGDPWTGRLTKNGVPFHLSRTEAGDRDVLRLYQEDGMREVQS
jgi:hypothetical protein